MISNKEKVHFPKIYFTKLVLGFEEEAGDA